jgi:hypothetical protein
VTCGTDLSYGSRRRESSEDMEYQLYAPTLMPSLKYSFRKRAGGNQRRSEVELEDESLPGVLSSYLRDVSVFVLKLRNI